jgi:hypothetical protein
MCSIDALPGPGSSAKHAAGRPAMPILCARAATDPAPLQGDLARRARAGSHTVAVADHVWSGADTRGWVRRGRGRVAICAGEPAGVCIDARWHAISRVAAGWRIACDLK